MEAVSASARCPACEMLVPLERRTMGDILECPGCHAGFRIELERAGEEFRTSVFGAGPPPEPSAELAAKIAIKGVLGRGGQGTVYRVRPKGAPADYALKFLDAAPVAGRAGPQDLSTELNHPNIVGVFAIGVDGPHRYALYEIVEGRALSAVIAQGPLPVEQIVELAFQMAAGLAHSHAHGIVHRDFKPDNVLVTTDGQAKIADFGIGRWIGTRNTLDPEAEEGFIGTPGYAAPEQISGWGVIRATDVYAFGMTLYEMWTGRLPFTAPSLEVLLHHQVNTEPPPPAQFRAGLAPELGQLIMDCLRKSPASRPQSMDQVMKRLEALAFAVGAPVPLPVEPEPLVPIAPLAPAAQALVRKRMVWVGVVFSLWLTGLFSELIGLGTPLTIRLDLIATAALGVLLLRIGTETKSLPSEWIAGAFRAEHESAGRIPVFALFMAACGFAAELNTDLDVHANVVGPAIVRLGLWPLLLAGAVHWLLDAASADVREHESRGFARLALTGPATCTVRIAGGAAVTPPCILKLKVGRHALQLDSGGRTSRYSIELLEPCHAAFRVFVNPEGPRATSAAGARARSELRVLYGPGLRMLWCAAAAAIAIVAVLRVSGIPQRLNTRPRPQREVEHEAVLAHWQEVERQERALALGSEGVTHWVGVMDAMVKQGRGDAARTEIVAKLAVEEPSAPLMAALCVALEHYHYREAGGAYHLAIAMDPTVKGIPPNSRARTWDRSEAVVALCCWLLGKVPDTTVEHLLVPHLGEDWLHDSVTLADLLCHIGHHSEACLMLKRLQVDKDYAEKSCGCSN